VRFSIASTKRAFGTTGPPDFVVRGAALYTPSRDSLAMIEREDLPKKEARFCQSFREKGWLGTLEPCARPFRQCS
jgi:hypothetical protein